jgi:hypothetical protein
MPGSTYRDSMERANFRNTLIIRDKYNITVAVAARIL